MENETSPSILSRLGLRMSRFRRSERAVGWVAHPAFLAVIADVVLVALLILFSPGSMWQNLFGAPIGIHFSVLIALIALPIGIVAIKNWIGWTMLVVAAIAVATFFLSHGVI